MDLLFVRELTGGTYFAKPKKIWETKSGTRAVDTTLYTEQEIERAVRRGLRAGARVAARRSPRSTRRT